MLYTNKVQIALFFLTSPDRTDEIFYSLNKKLNNLFDAQPVILPLPDDAPRDVPSVQANTKNGLYALVISKLRIDFVLNNTSADDDSNIRADEFKELSLQFVRGMYDMGYSFNRIGLISINILDDENPVLHIRDQYFKDKISSPFELSLRFNNRHTGKALVVNDITDIASQEIVANNVVTKRIIINKDINNMPVPKQSLSRDKIFNFIEEYYCQLLYSKVKELI